MVTMLLIVVSLLPELLHFRVRIPGRAVSAPTRAGGRTLLQDATVELSQLEAGEEESWPWPPLSPTQNKKSDTPDIVTRAVRILYSFDN